MHAGTLKAFTRLHRASGFNGDDAFVHTADGLFVDLLNLEQLKDARGALPAGRGMGARVSLRGRVVHRASPVDLHLWVEALQVTAPASPSSLQTLVGSDSVSLGGTRGQLRSGRALLTPSKRGLKVAHYSAAIDPSCTLKYPSQRHNGSSYEVRARCCRHLLPKRGCGALLVTAGGIGLHGCTPNRRSLPCPAALARVPWWGGCSTPATPIRLSHMCTPHCPCRHPNMDAQTIKYEVRRSMGPFNGARGTFRAVGLGWAGFLLTAHLGWQPAQLIRQPAPPPTSPPATCAPHPSLRWS